MFLQERQAATAVPFDVFQLTADFAERFVLPRHRQGRDAPTRVPRNALVTGSVVQRDILLSMTFGTVRGEVIAIAPKYPWSVLMLIVPLKRLIAGGVAIHTTGMANQFAYLREDCARPIGSVWN
jgi:hypothetical protein